MREGDLMEGELEIGQVSALLDDLPRAGQLVDQLVQEFKAFNTRQMSKGFFWKGLE